MVLCKTSQQIIFSLEQILNINNINYSQEGHTTQTTNNTQNKLPSKLDNDRPIKSNCKLPKNIESNPKNSRNYDKSEIKKKQIKRELEEARKKKKKYT